MDDDNEPFDGDGDGHALPPLERTDDDEHDDDDCEEAPGSYDSDLEEDLIDDDEYVEIFSPIKPGPSSLARGAHSPPSTMASLGATPVAGTVSASAESDARADARARASDDDTSTSDAPVCLPCGAPPPRGARLVQPSASWSALPNKRTLSADQKQEFGLSTASVSFACYEFECDCKRLHGARVSCPERTRVSPEVVRELREQNFDLREGDGSRLRKLAADLKGWRTVGAPRIMADFHPKQRARCARA